MAAISIAPDVIRDIERLSSAVASISSAKVFSLTNLTLVASRSTTAKLAALTTLTICLTVVVAVTSMSNVLDTTYGLITTALAAISTGAVLETIAVL